MEILNIKNLHKSYGGVEVIKGVDLVANRGDVISVIGSSGSGKSTFLRCINFLENPTLLEMNFLGKKLDLKKKHGLLFVKHNSELLNIRKKIGFVFQEFNLWSHKTVLDNIIEAPIYVLGIKKQQAEKKALELLAKVGLLEKKNAYPKDLSGGQKQRAAIARVLAMEPELILFDEPTSALDPQMVQQVLEIIQSLSKEGITMIIVTHEIAFAKKISTKVVYFHNGKIEEQGSTDILSNPQTSSLQQFIKDI